MLFSNDYNQEYDTNCDGKTDLIEFYQDWDSDGIPHLVASHLDTDFEGTMDTFIEYDPSTGDVLSIYYDSDNNGQVDCVDYNGDGIVDETIEEKSWWEFWA